MERNGRTYVLTDFSVNTVQNGAAHSGVGLPTSINLRQSPTGTSTGQLNVDSPSFGHSSQMILGHVTLTGKAKQQYGYIISQDDALSSVSKERPWHGNLLASPFTIIFDLCSGSLLAPHW